MSRQEWRCILCKATRAVSFCPCGVETFLCDKCIPSHFAGSQPHIRLPLSAYGQHTVPGYLERLQTRTNNYQGRKAQLLRNLEQVDACIAGLSAEVERTIAAMRDYQHSVLFHLNNIRRELKQSIDETIAEVEKTMYEDAPIVKISWTAVMREPTCDLNSLKFFIYKIDPSVIIQDILYLCNFSLEKSRLEAYRLPGLHDNVLRIFDVEESSTVFYSLSRTFRNGTSLCFISDNELLILERSPSKSAFLVQLPNPQVCETQSMHTPRCLPGLICVSSFVYVFGGDCWQCEKYSITSKEWTALPSMSASASGFTPCLYDKDIYLVKTTGPIDIFNISMQTMRNIEVNLGELCDNSISTRLNDEIVILTCSRQIGRWKLGTLYVSVENYEMQGERPNCQSPPVVAGRRVYFTRWTTGNLNTYSLNTNVLSSVTFR